MFPQEKIVFVTCDDDDKVADIRRLVGKYVRWLALIPLIKQESPSSSLMLFLLWTEPYRLEASPSHVNLILSTEDRSRTPKSKSKSDAKKKTDKKSVSKDDEESKPVSSSSDRLLYSSKVKFWYLCDYVYTPLSDHICDIYTTFIHRISLVEES